MSDKVLGFIGLGVMGSRMAMRLLEAGHTLVVCDRVDAAVAPLVARGARRVETARELADQADIVLGSLPTPAVVHSVALGPDGLLQGQRARTFVDLSTTGPRVAQQVAAAFAEQGRAVLDAPVSGGAAGAEKGTLSIMVSGPAETYAALEPIFAAMGRPSFIGEGAGQAQVLKLCNNLLSVTSIAISAEVMVMGAKAGLDAQKMVDVISTSSGRNGALQDKFPRHVLTRTFDFGFPTALSLKDVRLCLEEAEAMGVPMVVGSAVRQMLGVSAATFGPDADFMNLVRVVEQWGGAEVKG